jgi:hypothetical protein
MYKGAITKHGDCADAGFKFEKNKKWEWRGQEVTEWFNKNSNRRAVLKTTNDFTIYKKGAYCVQIEGWKEHQNEASVESAEKMLKHAFARDLTMGYKEGDGTCKAEGFPV